MLLREIIKNSNLALYRFFATVSDEVKSVFGTYHIKVTKNFLGMSQKPQIFFIFHTYFTFYNL